MAATSNPDHILVPGRTHVYIAPTGSTAPPDTATALDPAWIDVGLTTTDSLKFTTSPNFQDVNSAQSDFPTRTFQTSDSATIEVTLQEWDSETVVVAFGGGSVTQPNPTTSPNEWKFTPPQIGDRAEKSCIIEVIDGTKIFRYVFPRTLQKAGVAASFNKGSEAQLPLQMAVLGSDGTDAWYLLVGDADFDS